MTELPPLLVYIILEPPGLATRWGIQNRALENWKITMILIVKPGIKGKHVCVAGDGH